MLCFENENIGLFGLRKKTKNCGMVTLACSPKNANSTRVLGVVGVVGVKGRKMEKEMEDKDEKSHAIKCCGLRSWQSTVPVGMMRRQKKI